MKLLLCICVCLSTAATKAQYRIDQWTAENGLPQNSVYALKQTRDGYLWLATVDGLARFDGARFKVFNKSNSPGIVNNRFISLFEDTNGALWAGTEESGIVRFSGGRFEHFGADMGVPRTVGWIEAHADGGGTIFHGPGETIGFRDGRFSPVDSQSDSPAAESSQPSNKKIVCRINVETRLSECFVNEQWLTFSYAAPSRKEKFISVEQEINPDGSSRIRFLSAAQAANGTVWLITADGRLAQAADGRVTRIYDERDGLPKYPMYLMIGERLGLVAKDVNDAVWFVDLPSMQKELLFKKGAGPFPLDKLKILSTYADGEGNLWFGTNRDGLFRARKQVITAYSESDGLIDNSVYPIYQDRAGTIWIGSVGLSKYENGSFTAIEATRGFVVTAVGEDPLGRILINNYGALYVRENDRFVPFEPDKIPAVGFVYAIHSDLEKALWLGSDNGLRRFKDGILSNFTTSDGLAGNDVKVIIEAQGGGLWIGTYDGLTRMQNGKFTSWREADGLPSRTVRALYEDADGTLWIGSYDGGLARFKDGKFTPYNMKTGLPNDGAFQILEDDNRNFWISSNRGIYRVNKNELNDFADGKILRVNSIAYGKSDGMLNPECNGGRWPAGIRAHDGRLWFPTLDGVAVIEPGRIKVNSQPPRVVIETVKIDNNEVGFEKEEFESNNEESQIPNPKSQIEIAPSQQNFEIAYTALSFINSENLRFKYKLEGLDDDWVDAETRRQAYFSHVPPGDYTFRVIAANSDGVWNEEGASLQIIVHPAFYQTWWFLILTVLTIAALAFLLYSRRLAEAHRRQMAQEEFSRQLINAHESERRRIAAELHDSLGQHLAMIRNGAIFGEKTAKDLEDAKTQFGNISEQTMLAITEVREISHNLRPYLLDRLGLTKAVKALLEKIEDNSEMEIDSRIEPVDGIFAGETEIGIYRIIQESINNILKHSEATGIEVLIEKGERFVTIKITDNGKGFEVQNDKRGGFGLLGMRERAKMLGGTITIDSELQKGTSILIKIDIK